MIGAMASLDVLMSKNGITFLSHGYLNFITWPCLWMSTSFWFCALIHPDQNISYSTSSATLSQPHHCQVFLAFGIGITVPPEQWRWVAFFSLDFKWWLHKQVLFSLKNGPKNWCLSTCHLSSLISWFTPQRCVFLTVGLPLLQVRSLFAPFFEVSSAAARRFGAAELRRATQLCATGEGAKSQRKMGGISSPKPAPKKKCCGFSTLIQSQTLMSPFLFGTL